MPAPNRQKCVTCKKERTGRFTRKKGSSGRGWTPNSLPAWHCWECLLPGDGADETSETKPVIDVKAERVSMNPGTTYTPPPVDKETTIKETTALAPLVAGVIITDQTSYSAADMLLNRIQTARKMWNQRMYGTKDKPGPIPNIRAGLDQLYALNREIDAPLEKLEEQVKGAMKSFKVEEMRAARRIEEEKAAEQRRLNEEAFRLEQAKEAARTPQMKGKLDVKLAAVAQQQEVMAAVEAPQAVIGNRSSGRTVKKWRLAGTKLADERIPANLTTVDEFIVAILEGKVPYDCLKLDTVYINKMYKESRETVLSWPGIEEFEDVLIIGR